MAKITNTLLISTQINAGIIDKIAAELNQNPVRKRTGENMKLAVFIKKELRNYALITHIILDLSAFEEQGEELLKWLDFLKQKLERDGDERKIIIYADRFYDKDDFIWEIFKLKLGDIVTNYSEKNEKKNIALMQSDLRECFSENGLSIEKTRRFDREYANRTLFQKAQDLQSEQQNSLNFSKANFAVAVAGALERIGTTTVAVKIADYIARKGGKAAYKFLRDNGAESTADNSENFASERQLEALSAAHGGQTVGNCTEIHGIDFYLPNADISDNEAVSYNAVVLDCGNAAANPENVRDYCPQVDFVILVGGTNSVELPLTLLSQKQFSGITYTLAVNFSDDEAFNRNLAQLSRNLNDTTLMPFAPKLFGCEICDSVFDKWFQQFENKES